jgi:hypothetical protein
MRNVKISAALAYQIIKAHKFDDWALRNIEYGLTLETGAKLYAHPEYGYMLGGYHWRGDDINHYLNGNF